MEYQFRTCARVLFTAITPLRIGSGNNSLVSDAMVCTDANGLPYVPGSSLAGILRHRMAKGEEDLIFGSESHGSTIILSDANLVYEGGKVVEGLLPHKTPFLAIYSDLPIRQHVRIGHSGAAEKSGKYDEQIVFAGSRFCFTVELLSKNHPEKDVIKTIFSNMMRRDFRIGGGTRKGFGQIRIDCISYVELDLSQEADLSCYLEKTASLNDQSLRNRMTDLSIQGSDEGLWETMRIELRPEDFFLFGSGFGDDVSDITPAVESRIEWKDGEPSIIKKCTLIPATSVKGAIAHRTAFYYNLFTRQFAESEIPLSELTGSKNKAVCQLFGCDGSQTELSCRGKVILSDIYLNNTTEKILDHVVIDSYTGGSLDGGLFNEKVLGTTGNLILDILVEKSAFSGDENVGKAFKSAIQDLCDGFLPLGGGVNRGHGVFTGKILQ